MAENEIELIDIADSPESSPKHEQELDKFQVLNPTGGLQRYTRKISQNEHYTEEKEQEVVYFAKNVSIIKKWGKRNVTLGEKYLKPLNKVQKMNLTVTRTCTSSVNMSFELRKKEKPTFEQALDAFLLEMRKKSNK